MNNFEIKKEILNNIIESDKIIIVRHIRPDGDCVGASLGLKKIIQETYPQKEIKVLCDDYASYLNFLGDEQEQVTEDYYTNALIIALDTATKERISNKHFTKGKKIIKIDHHIETDPYGDIRWVNENISSVCEMITDFYYTFKDELKITKEAAQCLFLGIVTDTGRFKFSSCNGTTLRMAGLLLDMNLDIETIYSNIYLKDFESFKLQSEVYQKTKLTNNGVAYVYITQKMQKKYHLSSTEASAMISTIEGIRGSIIWIAFIDNLDKTIRVRLRSRFMNINKIAEAYGGGGHDKASGAIINNKKQMKELLLLADKAIKDYKENNDNWL